MMTPNSINMLKSAKLSSKIHFDISGTRLLRHRLLELGQTFAQAGILQQAGEVFFLSPDDVREARNRLERLKTSQMQTR